MKDPILRLASILAVVFGLSGCLNIDETYTVNPDGTGKVVRQAILTEFNLQMGEPKTPEERAMKMVKEELERADGVDVWKDVSYERLSDDKVKFMGTAYFQDIAKLVFHNNGTKVSTLSTITLDINDHQMTLQIKDSKKDIDDKASASVDSSAPPDTSNDAMTEEKIVQKISDIKAKWAKTKAMIDPFMSDMKIARRFYLPGSIVESKNMKTAEDGALSNEFQGAELIKFFDQHMSDEAWLREQAESGKDPFKDKPQDDDALNEVLFGERGAVKAVVQITDSPLFDYGAEVAQAKEAYPAIMTQLGFTPRVKAEMVAPGDFRIGGARLISESDQDNDIRPFNWDKGYTLSIVGALPEQATSVKEARIESAATDNGEDLLTGDTWQGRAQFPRLGKDQQTVLLDVNLNVPGPDAKSISTLKGKVVYLVSAGTRQVDLIQELVAGAQGAEFNSRIDSIGDSKWNTGQQELVVKIELAKDKIKSANVTDASGQPISVSTSTSWSGDQTTYSFSVNEGGQFPADGRITIEVYEGLKEYEMPFEIKDVTFLGKTIKNDQ